MAVRRKVEPPVTEKIEAQLGPFFDECERRGYPISEYWVKETLPGIYDYFGLWCIADWSRGMGPDKYLTILSDILRETVPYDLYKILTIVVRRSPEVMEEIRAENCARARAREAAQAASINNNRVYAEHG